MGSPEFALPSLERLAGDPRFHVALVLTQPDRPRGRGQKLAPTPIRRRAEALGLPTHPMDRSSYLEGVAAVREARPRAIAVVAFGAILRSDLLNLPELGCVNLHPSLLPRYRGVSPIQAALLAGDRETGCTTILMDEGVDTGPILLQCREPIHPDDTAGSLGDRLARRGADLLAETLLGLAAGRIRPRPQEGEVSTTAKIRKRDGWIRWSDPADRLDRRIRAMTPRPGAFVTWGDRRVQILSARPVPAEESPAGSAEPGTVLTRAPLRVACGEGSLELRELKPEGRAAMDARSFVNGYRVRPGDRFGSLAEEDRGGS
jgi:methionyl-tRNA formyltransferase